MSKVKRIWTCDRRFVGVDRWIDQMLVKLGRRFPIAHRPMCDHIRRQARNLRKCSDNKLLRNADAKTARDKFVVNKPLRIAHSGPGFNYLLVLKLLAGA